MLGRVLPLTALLLMFSAVPGTAQVISIRTVPISQAHQFDLFPSRGLGMGGVAIAFDDSLHDPFTNPAKGSRVRASRFFGSPGVYSVSNGAGGGRTLPVGALVRSGNWFGGGAAAVQQVDLSEPTVFFQGLPFAPCLACDSSILPTPIPGPAEHNGNAYLFAMIGRTFPTSGWSLAGSVLWSNLHGVDGVDLLYAGSSRLTQRGHSVDLRSGVLKEMTGDRSVSALLFHSRYAATHDVFYFDSFWNPGTRRFEQRPRLEENLDHTNTWGLHLEYAHPVGSDGWRLGWVATTNLMSHPKIPNYEIQNIPRDPGNSEAFQVGVGASRSVESTTFAADLLLEPIWSYTWADTPVPLTTDGGITIPAGGRTIENWFRFTNAMLRLGVGHESEFDQGRKAVGLQLGLALHGIRYTLRQQDNIQHRSRSLKQDWLEWTPTWGVSLQLPALELRYRGSATHGTGRPGVFPNSVDALTLAASPQILVAPNGPVSLTGVRVMTHQVSIAFPFR